MLRGSEARRQVGITNLARGNHRPQQHKSHQAPFFSPLHGLADKFLDPHRHLAEPGSVS
jgi:hypothetical protein